MYTHIDACIHGAVPLVRGRGVFTRDIERYVMRAVTYVHRSRIVQEDGFVQLHVKSIVTIAVE